MALEDWKLRLTSAKVEVEVEAELGNTFYQRDLICRPKNNFERDLICRPKPLCLGRSITPTKPQLNSTQPKLRKIWWDTKMN